MNHYSIKLETLGSRWNAAIVAIACQQFDIETGKMGSAFYQEIDLASSLRSGTITADSILAWMTHAEKARKMLDPAQERTSLATTLLAFTTWMRGMRGAPTVWCDGSSKDISILEHAYDVGSVGLKEPWVPQNIRDLRTLAAVLSQVVSEDRKPPSRSTPQAVYDAEVNARMISNMWQELKKPKTEVVYVSKDDDDDI